MAVKPINQSSLISHERTKPTNIQEKVYRFALSDENIRLISQKLIDDPSGSTGRTNPTIPPKTILDSISKDAIQDIRDINNIFEILPDTEMAMNILVASIISPKDMMNEELTWSMSKTSLPSPISSKILDIVRETFIDHYKINRYLSPALEDSLFKKGSYILGIFPESAIDDIINSKTNVTLESFNQLIGKHGNFVTKGILGNNIVGKKTQLSLEDHRKILMGLESNQEMNLQINKHLSVTDNLDVIKSSLLQRALINQKVSSVLNPSMESYTQINPSYQYMAGKTPADILYKGNNQQTAPIISITDNETSSRHTLGRPLIMTLPHESTIPVTIPGDPTEHIGYFVLLDEYGNPLGDSTESDFFSQLKKDAQSSRDAISGMISEVSYWSNGQCNKSEDVKRNMSELVKSYATLVEQDLITRLNNGIYGKNVEIAHVEPIYRIMLSRALKGLNSQLLFIPKNLLTYIAFDFNQYGVGRSLVSKAKLLATMTATLLFAQNMATMRNAISRRKVTIELDERDDDPQSTIESFKTQFVLANSMSYAYASLDPTDINTSLFNASVDFVPTGHPAVPAMGISVEGGNNDRQIVDDTTMDNRKNSFLAALGVPPETVANAINPEFSAQVMTQNAIFAKRTMKYSTGLSELLSEFIRNVTLNDGTLLKEITEVIRDNVNLLPDDYSELLKNTSSALSLIKLIVSEIEVYLPLPDIEKSKALSEAITNYEELVDKVLPAFINEDIIRAVIPEEEGSEAYKSAFESLTGIFKGELMRDFIAREGILPEINDVLKVDSDNPNVEFFERYWGNVTKVTSAFGGILEKIKTEITKLHGGSTNDSDDDSGESDDFGYGSIDSVDDLDVFGDDSGSGDSPVDTVAETGETKDGAETEEGDSEFTF